MEKVVPRWHAGEAQMRGSPGWDELDPAEGVNRRCKKNSPSILSYISKRTREGCNQAPKSGQFKVGETGKGQLLWELIEIRLLRVAIGGGRMVGFLEKAASPLWATTQKRSGDCITTMRRRDVSHLQLPFSA